LFTRRRSAPLMPVLARQLGYKLPAWRRPTGIERNRQSSQSTKPWVLSEPINGQLNDA
jgi:hypothetical protein